MRSKNTFEALLYSNAFMQYLSVFDYRFVVLPLGGHFKRDIGGKMVDGVEHHPSLNPTISPVTNENNGGTHLKTL